MTRKRVADIIAPPTHGHRGIGGDTGIAGYGYNFRGGAFCKRPLRPESRSTIHPYIQQRPQKHSLKSHIAY